MGLNMNCGKIAIMCRCNLHADWQPVKFSNRSYIAEAGSQGLHYICRLNGIMLRASAKYEPTIEQFFLSVRVTAINKATKWRLEFGSPARRFPRRISRYVPGHATKPGGQRTSRMVDLFMADALKLCYSRRSEI